MDLLAVAATPLAELEARLDHISASPSAVGSLELIVARPLPGERTLLDEGRLDAARGLVGDGWLTRGTSRGPHADPDKQVTLMSSRVIEAVAGADHDAWAQSGDQLYVDLDLGYGNLPAGSRLRIGEATIELTAAPHRGCAKFRVRFGDDALRFVNAREQAELAFRGRNAQGGGGGNDPPGRRDRDPAAHLLTGSAPPHFVRRHEPSDGPDARSGEAMASPLLVRSSRSSRSTTRVSSGS